METLNHCNALSFPYDSESISLYVSGASWMQRDAAIVTGLFVAANACFIIFSNHWFNVSAAKKQRNFQKTMVFKSCGSMLPIVAVVVWGSIVQGRIFSRNFAPERQSNG